MNMKKLGMDLVLLGTILLANEGAVKPKLILQITVDQLRGDL